MSNPESKTRVIFQWAIEGAFVVWVVYHIIMWADPELVDARRTIVLLLGGTFFVYEFGRWLADRLVRDDDD